MNDTSHTTHLPPSYHLLHTSNLDYTVMSRIENTRQGAKLVSTRSTY